MDEKLLNLILQTLPDDDNLDEEKNVHLTPQQGLGRM